MNLYNNYSDIISNVRVMGETESIIASGYPMLDKPKSEDEFRNSYYNFDKHFERAKNLALSDIGSGHDNFLNGIIVQFDLKFTVKAWTEAERYHFFDFVSSMSSMHRLTKMDYDTVFCKYVTENTRNEMKRLLEIYNQNPNKDNKLTLLYNCPTGLQLTARMTTNYRQLKTIYNQRKNHLLPEWKLFCQWIKDLPYSEFIIGDDVKNE